MSCNWFVLMDKFIYFIYFIELYNLQTKWHKNPWYFYIHQYFAGFEEKKLNNFFYAEFRDFWKFELSALV